MRHRPKHLRTTNDNSPTAATPTDAEPADPKGTGIPKVADGLTIVDGTVLIDGGILDPNDPTTKVELIPLGHRSDPRFTRTIRKRRRPDLARLRMVGIALTMIASILVLLIPLWTVDVTPTEAGTSSVYQDLRNYGRWISADAPNDPTSVDGISHSFDPDQVRDQYQLVTNVNGVSWLTGTDDTRCWALQVEPATSIPVEAPAALCDGNPNAW